MTGAKMLCCLSLGVGMIAGAAKLPDLATSSSVAKRLTIVCLDVDTKEVGDAFVITTPGGRTMLIDAGMPGNGTNVVLPYLRDHGVKVIDYLLVSHPHDDHFGGVPELLLSEEVTVKQVLWGKPLPFAKMEKYEACYAGDSQKLVEAIVAACGRKQIPLVEIAAGQTLDLGDGVRGEILAAASPALDEYPTNYINNNSIIMRLTYGTFSMLFTGDAGFEEEAKLLAGGENVQAKVLKVGHHGGAGSTSAAWLKAVAPKVAIIPMPQWLTVDERSFRVRDLLKTLPVQTYRTAEFGRIEIHSDGTCYQITTMK